MTAHDPTRDLARLQATVATLQADLTRLKRRRRLPRRFLPLALAVFLVALIPLAALAANPFTDLNPGSPHNANIDAIYTAGITTGCVPNAEYCPSGLVTREEMASFLARTAGIGDNPPVANAKTAQTAQSATTAQNALALGGQPPSYYQPAGQPIANAVTAQNAGNANTVGGYAPTELVRVARAGAEGGFSLTSDCTTYVPLAQATLTAPRAGFIHVTGAVGAQYSSGTGQTAIFARPRIGAAAGPRSIAYAETPGAQIETAAVTWVFPVAAGPQTIVLEGCRFQFTGAAAINAFSPQLTALFVPFGSGGAGTLEAPDTAPGSSGGNAGP